MQRQNQSSQIGGFYLTLGFRSIYWSFHKVSLIHYSHVEGPYSCLPKNHIFSLATVCQSDRQTRHLTCRSDLFLLCSFLGPIVSGFSSFSLEQIGKTVLTNWYFFWKKADGFQNRKEGCLRRMRTCEISASFTIRWERVSVSHLAEHDMYSSW